MAESTGTSGNTMENNRIVFLSGGFNEEKAKDVITNILTMEAKNPNKDILLIIDSYGGYVHSLLAIHDVIKHYCRCDIVTLGIGKQMSCGQLLLMSGTKGKRFVTPNSRILMHQISSVAFGKLSDMEIDINESKSLQKIIEDLIVKYTKITKKKLPELMSKDSFFSAKEAMDLGIVDGIVMKPNDLYRHPNVKL
jgi:ATP-dependent Clp protease protease subunit